MFNHSGSLHCSWSIKPVVSGDVHLWVSCVRHLGSLFLCTGIEKTTFPGLVGTVASSCASTWSKDEVMLTSGFLYSSADKPFQLFLPQRVWPQWRGLNGVASFHLVSVLKWCFGLRTWIPFEQSTSFPCHKYILEQYKLNSYFDKSLGF